MRKHEFYSNAQIEELENILLAEKERILNKGYDETMFCLEKEELSDEMDAASINSQKQHNLRMANRDTFLLKKINKALDKIKRGTYGICEECDEWISFERLKARPVAELCITCKEETEAAENASVKHSKSMGQTLSELRGR